ncbi:GMC family oxidoreductase [Pantoea dispersa]|uniref:Sorbosone dehydrogenase n=1 Tax=Pantoea dispersa TaxID=59814 RepID=A0A8E1S2N4_9GAMM|nr:GMC family oxidoreductase N-terminal domain-containing protein [Pantoea dispersa]KTR91073.1 sorbosone dehydrogenase [Pantoea dispersa]KTS23600.1 sorbosone dehydrogenase [Pantoea dispersa]KTS62885.1 sorbosone dehydrogenase [Pantoea dispersa]KTS69832.1 sorbosone dehydrogenase [Pantoea dispersa]
MKEYDYIVVGGGSAGCIVAARLVSEGNARVLLLEAGRDEYHPVLKMPAGYMKFLVSDRFLTMHQTEAQPQLNGRGVIVPQAKVLGGGSTVNAMVYMRGHKQDYADWNQALGDQGIDWSWEALLPHFTAIEDNDHLGAPNHGVGGPMKVSHLGHFSPLSRAYVKTLQGLGIPYTADFNSGNPSGVGFMQHTIDGQTRQRCSVVDAFINPLRHDARLTLVTGAQVEEVLFDGTCASGVRYRQDGQPQQARASREVILAAGAYQTPKLLMLSGIGPQEQLKQHGITVRHALPGVGKNLQDHYEVPVVASTRGAFGYYGQDRGWPMVKAGLQYLLFKSGPVTTTGVETCAFFDPLDFTATPTIQMFCVPTVYLDRDVMGADPGDGVTVNSLLLRPKATGEVTLRDNNASSLPVIDTQIFGHPDDLARTLAGFRFARQVLAAAPIREMVDQEIFPGAEVTSDDAISAHCRRMVKTGYHPVGTCRMGHDDDPLAVLHDDLRVRGVQRLRVVDASMMPNIISGNTNAVVMAVAHRAAELVLQSQIVEHKEAVYE